MNYRYDIDYTIEGKSSRETGRDVIVLEKHDGRWLAVWRMVDAPGGVRASRVRAWCQAGRIRTSRFLGGLW